MPDFHQMHMHIKTASKYMSIAIGASFIVKSRNLDRVKDLECNNRTLSLNPVRIEGCKPWNVQSSFSMINSCEHGQMSVRSINLNKYPADNPSTVWVGREVKVQRQGNGSLDRHV